MLILKRTRKTRQQIRLSWIITVAVAIRQRGGGGGSIETCGVISGGDALVGEIFCATAV